MASSAVGRSSSVRRLAHSVLVALVAVLGALLIGMTSTIAAAVQLLAYTPIIMTGTFTSHPGSAYVAMAMNQYIKPSRSADHPPETPDYNAPIALDTPEQLWPISGLYSDTFDASIRSGVRDLEGQIAQTEIDSSGQPIIVFGFSQSAVIAVIEKRRLAAQYPVGTADPVPDIQFTLIGDLDRPNGGVLTRFEGAYIPFANVDFNGPAPVHTNFETVDIARQYDGFADFPLYPLNLIADLNALAGMVYVHTQYQAVSLDPLSPRYVAGTTEQQFGDTVYYTIPTAHLPLLQPLRDLGVPEPLLAAVEPALRVIVEAGYDRTINPGVATPARLIPLINPVKFAGDLIDALGQGIRDAADEIEHPTPKPSGAVPAAKVLTSPARAHTTHTVSRVRQVVPKVSPARAGVAVAAAPARAAHARPKSVGRPSVHS
jgi:PE-PPE domain